MYKIWILDPGFQIKRFSFRIGHLVSFLYPEFNKRNWTLTTKPRGRRYENRLETNQ
jgi:hypothetical protein